MASQISYPSEDKDTLLKNENPWKVGSLYEYQYFNCPSCPFKKDKKQDFINHTFHIHPESVDYLRKISDGSLNDIIFPWEEVQDDKMVAHTFGDLYYGLEEKGIGKKQFDSITLKFSATKY